MKQLIKISQVKNNPNNPRLIKNDKFKKLVKSVQDFPEMLELRPIVVDENMIVLGGNMRLKACIEAGLKEVWIEVADLTEQQKKEFTIKDNVGFGEWEWDMLANEWEQTELEDWGLDGFPFEEEIEEKNEDTYSKKIDAPEYIPKGDKPKIEELYNENKTKELLTKISLSNITKEEKEFLIKASQRHIVFNYANIAEFYCHANKELQELMEDSALIIIDFKKAIQQGYVTLNEKITEQYLKDFKDDL
jgi:hypothetical protein